MCSPGLVFWAGLLVLLLETIFLRLTKHLNGNLSGNCKLATGFTTSISHAAVRSGNSVYNKEKREFGRRKKEIIIAVQLGAWEGERERGVLVLVSCQIEEDEVGEGGLGGGGVAVLGK